MHPLDVSSGASPHANLLGAHFLAPKERPYPSFKWDLLIYVQPYSAVGSTGLEGGLHNLRVMWKMPRFTRYTLGFSTVDPRCSLS